MKLEKVGNCSVARMSLNSIESSAFVRLDTQEQIDSSPPPPPSLMMNIFIEQIKMNGSRSDLMRTISSIAFVLASTAKEFVGIGTGHRVVICMMNIQMHEAMSQRTHCHFNAHRESPFCLKFDSTMACIYEMRNPVAGHSLRRVPEMSLVAACVAIPHQIRFTIRRNKFEWHCVTHDYITRSPLPRVATVGDARNCNFTLIRVGPEIQCNALNTNK